MQSLGSNIPCGEAVPDVAVIQTALCYLMTRYALRPCSGLVFTIAHHLQMLLAHPDVTRLPEERKKIHRELLQHWRSIAMQQEAAGLDCILSHQAAPH